MKLYSHIKDWRKSFFYCRDTSPVGQPPLPGFRDSRLVYSAVLNSWPSTEDNRKLVLVFKQIKALLAHGLSAIDLIRFWVGWQVQPLSERPKLMCEYSGTGDDMRISQVVFSSAETARATKKFLGEPLELVSLVSLALLWVKNPALEVRYRLSQFPCVLLREIVLSYCFNLLVCRSEILGG